MMGPLVLTAMTLVYSIFVHRTGGHHIELKPCSSANLVNSAIFRPAASNDSRIGIPTLKLGTPSFRRSLIGTLAFIRRRQAAPLQKTSEHAEKRVKDGNAKGQYWKSDANK